MNAMQVLCQKASTKKRQENAGTILALGRFAPFWCRNTLLHQVGHALHQNGAFKQESCQPILPKVPKTFSLRFQYQK